MICDESCSPKLVVEFASSSLKENLIFTGGESPMTNLMLSVLRAVAQFEREGIALAKQRDAHTGRKKALIPERVQELCARIGNGETKAALAREFGIRQETLYQYLRQDAGRKL